MPSLPALDFRRSPSTVLPDAVCLIALAWVCASQLAGLPGWLDLGLYDEADYLRRGLGLPRNGLPDPEWGPLYSLWYFALSALEPDPVALYGSSYRLLVVLPAVGIYVCARRLGGPPPLALLGSTLFALSAAAHILPRPTLLALVCLLAALFVSTFASRAATRAAVLATGALLGSFARPELFASFLLLAAVVAVLALRREWGFRKLIAFALVAAALIAVFGNPFGNKSDRRRYAFCQHFALGYVARMGLDFNPWVECEQALTRAFGPGVKSVGDAAARNPPAFLEHLALNLVRYPVTSVWLFIRGASRPATGGHALLLGAAAGWVLWALAWGRSRFQRARADPEVRLAGLLLAAVLVPTVLSAVLIFPREHYLVLQGVFTPLFLVAVFRATAEARERAATSGVLVVAAFAGACFLSIPGRPAALQHRQVLAALARETRELDKPLDILEAQGGYDVYLGRGARRISPGLKRPEASFEAFLAQRGVDVVVVDAQLLKDSRLRDDSAFHAFVASPARFGFSRAAVPGTERWLAIREQHVPTASEGAKGTATVSHFTGK